MIATDCESVGEAINDHAQRESQCGASSHIQSGKDDFSDDH